MTIIPANRITREKLDLSATQAGETWKNTETKVLGSSNGFVSSKKIKLAKKHTAPLASNVPVEEPRIIDTSTTSGFRQSPGERHATEPENLYGLDISILKSLNMDHLLEEKKAQQEQNTSKENWYL